jgi:hypothetical protein
MDTQEDEPISGTDVRHLTILAGLLYIGACLLFFLPIVRIYCGPPFVSYHTPPQLWKPFGVVILIDIMWGICMRKRWLIKSRRRRAYLSVLVYAVSAAILSDFYVIAFFKGAFS